MKSARRRSRELATQGLYQWLLSGAAPGEIAEQLSPVERSVLLVAAYEFKHHVDIPYRVVINEAVELAKTFGGSDGYKYVNAVLDRLAVQLRPAEAQGRGRG